MGKRCSLQIDERDPSSHTITDVLDAIPGAHERHQQGRNEAREGRTLPLADL
jgi:hypothetical protein